MWYRTLLLVPAVLAASGGCVLVDTPDVRVGVVGSPPPITLASPEPNAPYAGALQRVIRQQDKVAKELSRLDWQELLDEAGDWVKYVRVLSGYAESSHDPAQFRNYCDRLLKATQAVRCAARDRDPDRCRRAIDACDPILDRFVGTFPLTGSPPRRIADRPAHPQVP